MLVLMFDAGEELSAEDEPSSRSCSSTSRRAAWSASAARPCSRSATWSASRCPRPPEVTQRREFVRVPPLQNVAVAGAEDGRAGTKRHKALDISGGGMLLSGGDRLELGSLVRFTPATWAGRARTIEGSARVVRADERGPPRARVRARSRETTASG